MKRLGLFNNTVMKPPLSRLKMALANTPSQLISRRLRCVSCWVRVGLGCNRRNIVGQPLDDQADRGAGDAEE